MRTVFKMVVSAAAALWGGLSFILCIGSLGLLVSDPAATVTEWPALSPGVDAVRGAVLLALLLGWWRMMLYRAGCRNSIGLKLIVALGPWMLFFIVYAFHLIARSIGSGPDTLHNYGAKLYGAPMYRLLFALMSLGLLISMATFILYLWVPWPQKDGRPAVPAA